LLSFHTLHNDYILRYIVYSRVSCGIILLYTPEYPVVLSHCILIEHAIIAFGMQIMNKGKASEVLTAMLVLAEYYLPFLSSFSSFLYPVKHGGTLGRETSANYLFSDDAFSMDTLRYVHYPTLSLLLASEFS